MLGSGHLGGTDASLEHTSSVKGGMESRPYSGKAALAMVAMEWFGKGKSNQKNQGKEIKGNQARGKKSSQRNQAGKP